MHLDDFLNTYSNQALLVSFAAAHALAQVADSPVHLANLLDQLLDEETIRGKLPLDARNRARGALALLIRELGPEPERKGKLAFDLDALVEPSLVAMSDLSATHVSPLVFLGSCLANAGLLDPISAKSVEAVRLAGITAEMLLPGTVDKARQKDFTFRSTDLGVDGLGTDMTAMARAGFWPICPLVGMERELQSLVVLLNSMRSSAVVVGEPGVGKSALMAGFAWHIAHRTRPLIPPHMDDWTIVRIEAADLLKGTGARGDLEARVKNLLDFFGRNPKVVPFFEEVHKLLDTDDTTSRAIATSFKVPMAEERFRCVGATTDREYARFIASDDAMSSRFRRILVQEPTEEQAFVIVGNAQATLLRGKAAEYNIRFHPDAIQAAVKITSIYQRNDRLPRKAFNLLGETVSELTYKLSRVDAGDDQPVEITPEHVRFCFSGLTGIPVADLDGDRSAYFEHLGNQLRMRVRGQDGAVEAVTRHLALQANGYVDPRRPRGRFLFVGPPGVGKTELALTLAEEVMRERGSLIVVNMADYTKEDALSKFMGASPGYVGFGETPTIYSKVMMRPFSVVVLDEFEKAAPSLANPLISILDGRAEDSQGRPVDFSQCIFVMTSNAIVQRDVASATVFSKLAGSDPRWAGLPVIERLGLSRNSALETVAQALDGIGDAAMSRLLDELGGVDEEGVRAALHMRGGIWTQPLVDRIDRIILFNALDGDALHGILDRMIADRRKQASRALPSAIDRPEVRTEIIEWATMGHQAPSARRLERSLLRWLSSQVPAAEGHGVEMHSLT